jgi:hypothetical protein
MSVEPEHVDVSEAPSPALAASRAHRWYRIFSSLVFIVFCLELGAFLLVFPWLEYWDRNWFSSLVPEWRRYWENAYIRGAISGIGALNVYIAISEIFRLRRFALPERE